MTELYFTEPVADVLLSLLGEGRKAFVLTDENVWREVVCRNEELKSLVGQRMCLKVVPAGEATKSIDTATEIWRWLTENSATRSSLMVNIGGGMITDLGGFAAATFKRGMPFVNVPTSLLGAVDAALGGKTGVDFDGLKNQVGVFRQPEAVVFSTGCFATLPPEQLRSGYAEMLKHALLEGGELLTDTLAAADDVCTGGVSLDLLKRNIQVKQSVVNEDPEEGGLRRILNLGHTVGHALEEWRQAKGKPVPHGYAVAWGLTVELALAVLRHGLDSNVYRAVAKTVGRLYGSPCVTCNDYPALHSLMRHDKKNRSADEITLAMLEAPGRCLPAVVHDTKDIDAAFDLARDILD